MICSICTRVQPSYLNSKLTEIMPGLTAKVFRTYNASITLEHQLPSQMEAGLTPKEKARRCDTGACPLGSQRAPVQMVHYNNANRQVAILCNHQRTIPKGFGAVLEKLLEKARARPVCEAHGH